MRPVEITAITYLQTNNPTPTTNDRGPSVAQQVPKGLMSFMGCRLGTRVLNDLTLHIYRYKATEQLCLGSVTCQELR